MKREEYQAQMQELQEFLESLEQENDITTCIVVEGKNDVAALNNIGCKNVIELDRELYLVAEQIAEKYKRVIILTDLDKEGKLLYSKLKKNLSQLGVYIVEKPRELLFKTKLRQIEGLTKHLERQL